MKLASYIHGERESFGIVARSGIVDLAKRVGGEAGSLRELLDRGLLDRARAFAETEADIALDEVRFLPPIPRPGKTVCVGVNYRSRPSEYGRSEAPPYPSLFMRAAAAQTGHLQPLIKPPETEQFDFEGEIALVIGRTGRRIPEDRAMEHIAGYACFNEGSARDWMKHGVYNVTAGKNFDGSGSFGPWMVTADEIEDPAAMRICTRVNGATVQDDTTASLIAPFERLIAYISTVMTLDPGDIIATGTPSGVGGKRQPPVWLKHGDVVEIDVSSESAAFGLNRSRHAPRRAAGPHPHARMTR